MTHGSFTAGCKEGSKKTEEQEKITIVDHLEIIKDRKTPPTRIRVGFFWHSKWELTLPTGCFTVSAKKKALILSGPKKVCVTV